VAGFGGTFAVIDGRRVWVIARPPGWASHVLSSQIVAGSPAVAERRLVQGGWVVVSRQIAEQLHVGIGGRLTLPTPSGEVPLRIAALSSNLAWSPGALFIGIGQYARLWPGASATALGVSLSPGANVQEVARRVRQVVGSAGGGGSAGASSGGSASASSGGFPNGGRRPAGTSSGGFTNGGRRPAGTSSGGFTNGGRRPAGGGGPVGGASGLVVRTSSQLQASIDTLTGEGLRQLQEISNLLLAAAILAMAAALTSAVWQRRSALAGLRLCGVSPARLRRILLVEAGLLLSAGCVTGAIMGIYGQAIIDGYLRRVTGFPVAAIAADARPFQIFALVVIVVFGAACMPIFLASKVSPRHALAD
jgi:hypothetical protein